MTSMSLEADSVDAMAPDPQRAAAIRRELATLRTDIPLFDSIDDLRWKGPTPSFAALGARFDAAITQTERSPRGALAT